MHEGGSIASACVALAALPGEVNYATHRNNNLRVASLLSRQDPFWWVVNL